MTSWCFHPPWTMTILVKMGIFPNRGENKKNWNHHPDDHRIRIYFFVLRTCVGIDKRRDGPVRTPWCPSPETSRAKGSDMAVLGCVHQRVCWWQVHKYIFFKHHILCHIAFICHMIDYKPEFKGHLVGYCFLGILETPLLEIQSIPK